MEKKVSVRSEAVTSISKEKLEISFVATGDIHTIKSGQVMINQLMGQEIDGSLSNIYLRFLENDTIRFFPLIGKRARAHFFLGNATAKWTGKIETVSYEVTLKLADNQWFWEVLLDGQAKKIDLVYVADLGLADLATLRSNESYNAQYLNHQVFEADGYKIVSRQNQEQSTGFPTLETGAFGDLKVTGFLTDGFQFFGKSFKATRLPEALTKIEFANEIYQYELALTALKTESVTLQGKTRVTFYALYHENSAGIAKNSCPTSSLSVPKDEKLSAVPVIKAKMSLNQQINGQLLTNEALRARYPEAKFEESSGGQLLSGFTRQNTHFVSQAKESIVEREHGEIYLSGNSLSIKKRGLATSSFIYGLFNAHTVIGNTTMNKLLSNQREHLNLYQASGQRIFIKSNSAFKMLGMPSVFEMGYNFAKWVYVFDDDTLVIKNFVASAENSLQLEITSKNGKTYDFLILNQLAMDEAEYKSAATLSALTEERYELTADAASASKHGNPALKYRLQFDQPVKVLENETLFDGTTFIEESLVLFSVSASQLTLKISGTLDGELTDSDFLNFEQETAKYSAFIENEVLHGFKFTGTQPEFLKMATILPWYAHDMLIHYLSPHGLEQYGGAAWGTRDVSQGPIEFFLSTQHPEIVREILLTLFSHQFREDGTWPQWFMFDEYASIFAEESHGDVIVWPLFALAEYLEQTSDFDILFEQLPYVSRATKKFTHEKSPLRQHLQKELQFIKTHFLPGTHLSIYGNGDWDDTLQPANDKLKKQMTSSWTDALTYQALKKLAGVMKLIQPLEAAELDALAQLIKADFENWLLVDGVIPGFALQNETGQFEPIIHPLDSKINSHYRFLPMNRSIIAELVDNAQMERNLTLIDEHLIFNDGVRLMEQSPTYHGGISTHFKRAEQAANFGREIGLLYIHAQIRYVEMLAKVGRQEAWHALAQTIPVGLRDIVSNAEARQANVYFSSSDGAFKTRYEAQDNFEQLKTGAVGVKAGWRLYSSGPGIFTNQLITHLAGLRNTADGLIIDPIFPENTDTIDFDFELNNKRLHFHLVRADRTSVAIDNHPIRAENLTAFYRKGGVRIDKKYLVRLKPNSVIHVALQDFKNKNEAKLS
ncbi:MAG: cellobiose phosphorylase [Streptococcaceae bacterium]|nr:cellobiose phosphorylase [Streptococcaceae bacterium]